MLSHDKERVVYLKVSSNCLLKFEDLLYAHSHSYGGPWTEFEHISPADLPTNGDRVPFGRGDRNVVPAGFSLPIHILFPDSARRGRVMQ